MPLRTALPDSGSRRELVGEDVAVDARVGRGDRASGCPARRGPSRGAGSPRPACTSSVTSTAATTEPTREVTRACPPSSSRSGSASSGWTCSVQRSLALHQRRHVVHPAVVRAQVPAADEHEAVVGAPARRAPGGRRPRSGAGHSSTCRSASAAAPGSRGCSGPRSTPCGVRRAAGAASGRPGRAEAVAVRAEPQPARRGSAPPGSSPVDEGPQLRPWRRPAIGDSPFQRASSASSCAAGCGVRAPWPATIMVSRARMSHSSIRRGPRREAPAASTRRCCARRGVRKTKS